MRIALLQLNPTVGALDANASRIEAAVHAVRGRVDVCVTPEMALTGYPPRDLAVDPRVHRPDAGGGGTTRGGPGGRPGRAARHARAFGRRGRASPAQCGGASAWRHGGAGVRQDPAADLRRVRRGPVLRARLRDRGRDDRRPPRRREHLRGRLERSRRVDHAPVRRRPRWPRCGTWTRP